MFKVKKKDIRVTSVNCMFTSTDIVLVPLFVNFGLISYLFSTVFTVNSEQVNTDWD